MSLSTKINDRGDVVGAKSRHGLAIPLFAAGGRAPDTAVLVAENVDAQGRLCRDYEQSVVIGGQTTRASATVCRDGQGEWALAAATPQRASIASPSSICPRPGTVVE